MFRVRRLLFPTALLALVAAAGHVTLGESAGVMSSAASLSASGVARTSAGVGTTSSASSPDPTATLSADDPINRVVAISIDGLNPRAITGLGAAGAPAFHRLMREGAFTLNARTEREQTRTLPNHTGMLTGRRVDARHGGHGVTYNDDANGRTVHRSAGRYVSSVFDVVHDRGGRTALFSAKEKFALYQRTWNANGAPDRVGKDNGRAKIDTVTIDTDDARLVAAANRYLRSDPGEFVFLHIALPDVAGHAHGFMSAPYVAAVKRTDQLLATVLTTIAAEPRLRDETLVIVTADHGGNGASHSSAKKVQNFRVPFFAWGPGVARGADLYAINPGRRNPGSSRTTYRGVPPVRNGDVANLSTDVLDLPRVPGSQLNADRQLNLFPQ